MAARDGLIARLDAIPGVDRAQAEGTVRDLEATVSAAASKSATKVVIVGLIASVAIGLLFSAGRS